MELIDIGANLTHKSFQKDLEAVIERAQEVGVHQIVVTGTSETGSQRAQTLAVRFPGVLYATAGVHPHEANQWRPNSIYRIEELAALPQVVAIGETGLDFFRDFSPRHAQERAFEAQLELAVEMRLPVFLHERQAHKRFAEILSRYRDKLQAVVVHCFTGQAEELRFYQDLDLYIGITGWICDERRGMHLRKLLPEIPPERLLIETDAPFLVPRDLPSQPKGRRNEPAYLRHIAEVLASLLDTSPASLARQTTANARRFFSLPHTSEER